MPRIRTGALRGMLTPSNHGRGVGLWHAKLMGPAAHVRLRWPLASLPVQVSVTDEEVVKARDFALAEIIKLSDSYRDMKINKVMSAETARSVSASCPQPLSTLCRCVSLRLRVC